MAGNYEYFGLFSTVGCLVLGMARWIGQSDGPVEVERREYLFRS